jgi:hypothetical protein
MEEKAFVIPSLRGICKHIQALSDSSQARNDSVLHHQLHCFITAKQALSALDGVLEVRGVASEPQRTNPSLRASIS